MPVPPFTFSLSTASLRGGSKATDVAISVNLMIFKQDLLCNCKSPKSLRFFRFAQNDIGVECKSSMTLAVIPIVPKFRLSAKQSFAYKFFPKVYFGNKVNILCCSTSKISGFSVSPWQKKEMVIFGLY